jgi:tetratricopeptide (TPR) repeat protein
MTSIALRYTQKTASGFAATVRIGDGSEYEIEIQRPASDKEERRLAWYFEQWIHQSYTDTVYAEQARQIIRAYGESLFQQVFQSNPDVYSEYRPLRGSRVMLEVIGDDPAFQALHWETMRDPDLGDRAIFAIESGMVRRCNWKSPAPAKVPQSQTLNVLLVTARPGEESDLNYRTTSRPLMGAIANSRLPVNLVLLRPGTYEALERHLDATPEGYYHIIHFDVHGGVLTYEQMQSLDRHQRVLLKGRYGGRSDVQAFEGKKAFLFLETETKGQSDPVETQELANLLMGKRIPICILDACQLGQQVTGNTAEVEQIEDSLGSRLMLAGMRLVVAMRYSVLAEAAGLLMQRFYQEVVAEKTLLEALRLGRRELFNQKSRRALFNQQVDLEDWLLPVVYCNQPNLKIDLQPMTPEQEEAYYTRQSSQYRFPEPTYGFVGRDLEILKIEKSLLRHNILLVQGMGGTGKTTLLNYLRQWWQDTHFVAQTFYFGYDQRAWTLEQILFEVGKQVYGKYEQATFQAMPLEVQKAKLLTTLRAGCPTTGLPYALILDNLESITGQELAIQNTLPPAQQEQLRDFLSRLVGGRTFVVLGSRSEEAWLKPTTFRDAVYPLKGLDPESRSALAEKILQRVFAGQPQLVEETRQDETFLRLMKLLAGYPLAMEVVLANLRQQTPTEILAALDAADVGLDVESADKTKSILKCVEYSHSNLSESAQKLLLCLAPFSGFVFRQALPQYAEQLKQLEPFQIYNFDAFDSAIDEAIHWGLLSPLQENQPQLLTIQPIFPYFLKTKLTELNQTEQGAIRAAFQQYYQVTAVAYNKALNSEEPKKRLLGTQLCRYEYENLFHALKICLEKQESTNIFTCLFTYLHRIGDTETRLKLSEYVCQAYHAYPLDKQRGEIGAEISDALFRLGSCYMATQNYAEAKEQYLKDLALTEKLVLLSDDQKQTKNAEIYYQLGRVEQSLRNYEQARVIYNKALTLFIRLSNQQGQAYTYLGLSQVDYLTEEHDRALDICRNALECFAKSGKYHLQASVYHHLGMIYDALQNHEQARYSYDKAIEIHNKYEDRYSQAGIYHQLGILEQNLENYTQARCNYQKALEIKIEYNDLYNQASTYIQLGYVDRVLQHYEQARHNFQKGLCILLQYGDLYGQAMTYCLLGLLAEDLGEFQKAQTNFLHSLQTFVSVEDTFKVNLLIQHLSRIYRMTQEPELLSAIAQILGCTVAEVQAAIESAGEAEG